LNKAPPEIDGIGAASGEPQGRTLLGPFERQEGVGQKLARREPDRLPARLGVTTQFDFVQASARVVLSIYELI
jgi:hypothetical protein